MLLRTPSITYMINDSSYEELYVFSILKFKSLLVGRQKFQVC